LNLKNLVIAFLIGICTLWSANSQAQHIIQPGFDPQEYITLLSLGFFGSSMPDSNLRKNYNEPYQKIYTSPEVGLKNKWWLYQRNDKVGAIFIRGTIGDNVSWAANFYAGMIPAKGSLQLNDSTTFPYQLATDEKANVHAGWTVALASMAPDMVAKIKDLYNQGVKDFYIVGHSQGGVIAFLTRSYFHYLQQNGELPKDILFKTYCSAAPKPGNMYYAYDFEFITKGGWAYTIVNAADWVPESPYTIQRIQDMNPLNPLVNAKQLLKKQKFPLRFVGGIIYNKANRKPRKAQELYTKYLGEKVYKLAIKKAMPQLKQPQYVESVNYMRAGSPVILLPDEAYRQRFPDNGKDFFLHHHFAPYYFLLKRQYLSQGE